MHDGMPVVHACEWPALVTVPLDIPPSPDVVLFNVTCSESLVSLIVPLLSPKDRLLCQELPASSTLFMSGAFLEGYSVDPVLFLGINTSCVFFHLHSSSISSVFVSVNVQPSTFSAVRHTRHTYLDSASSAKNDSSCVNLQATPSRSISFEDHTSDHVLHNVSRW
jgi:hypothetical protein